MKTDLKGWGTDKLWVCEQHPNKVWPHDDCAGPGMPPSEEQWELIQSIEKECDVNLTPFL